MHRLVIVALVLFIAAGPAAAQELKTDQDKALYALGVASSLAAPLIEQRPAPAFRARAPPLPR